MSCKHDLNVQSVAICRDSLKHGKIIVDIWCRRCGLSGSTGLEPSDFSFDSSDEFCKELDTPDSPCAEKDK